MAKSRYFLRVMWPLAGVAVIAAGWCVYWYIASEKAKQSFAAYIEKAGRDGVEISCPDPRWGGFPFRFELRCSSIGARGSRGGLDIDFAGTAVRAVALAYNPLHLIVEIDGPFSFATQDRTRTRTEIASSGRPLRVSLRLKLDPNRADEVSVLVTGQAGTIAVSTPQDDTSAPVPYSLDRANIHIRFAAPPAEGTAPFDVAASVAGLVYGPDRSVLFGTEALRIETASLDARITAVPFTGRATFAERARRWQAAGGDLTVRNWDSTSNFLTGSSSGTLNLDRSGRLNGKLEWTVSGFDDLMQRLLNARLIDENAAAAADMILTVLGKPDPDAATPGLRLKTILKDGELYFGPFKVATIPPLF